MTHNDIAEHSRTFVADSGAEWPMLPDSEDTVWNGYGPVGLPTSYFIDAEGVVQRVHIGPVTEEQLAGHLAVIGLGPEVPPAGWSRSTDGPGFASAVGFTSAVARS